MDKHTRALELATSWVNGNRSFVMDEIKAEDSNGIRGDLNMLAAVAIVLESYDRETQLNFLRQATRLT